MTAWRPIFEYKDNPVTANAYAEAHAYGGQQQQQQGPTAIQQWLQGFMNNGGGGGPGYSDTNGYIPMNPYPESQPADDPYMIPTNPPDGGKGLVVPGHGGNGNADGPSAAGGNWNSGPQGKWNGGIQEWSPMPANPSGAPFGMQEIGGYRQPQQAVPDYARNPMVQYPDYENPEYQDPATGIYGMDYTAGGGMFVPYWESTGQPLSEQFPQMPSWDNDGYGVY